MRGLRALGRQGHCRPRPNGNLRPAAVWTAPSYVWGDELTPGGRRWQTPGRAIPETKPVCRWLYRPPAGRPFPPNGYGLSTWPAMSGNGLSTGSARRHQASTPASPCCVPDNPRGGPINASLDAAQPQCWLRARWSRAAHFFVRRTIAGVIARQRATRRWSTLA